jgi:hypothetical protein
MDLSPTPRPVTTQSHLPLSTKELCTKVLSEIPLSKFNGMIGQVGNQTFGVSNGQRIVLFQLI